jgi:long-chain acyl-CoA synthetase
MTMHSKLKSVYYQILGVAVLIGVSSAATALEVEGVKLADKVRAADTGPELVLNGAGVRTRIVFKVYVGALYLQQKRTTPDAVFSDNGPKRIAMHMLREVKADQFFAALSEGLKDNHTSEQLAKIEPQIREFEGIFKRVQNSKPGDIFLLDYMPGSGTRVMVNGDNKGTVTGGEFNTALLRMWLGDKPADATLKKALLGG